MPAAEASLINEHQRRHLGVTLGQVQRLLREVGALLNDRPAPNAIVVEANDLPDRFIRQAGPMLAELESRIAGLAARFGVPHRERSRYRWVRAVLSLSIDNLEDTRAGALHPYGGVNPGLAEALDPGLKDLKDRLRALLALLESGGEPQS